RPPFLSGNFQALRTEIAGSYLAKLGKTRNFFSLLSLRLDRGDEVGCVFLLQEENNALVWHRNGSTERFTGNDRRLFVGVEKMVAIIVKILNRRQVIKKH